MSRIDLSIGNEAVMPHVESDLFVDNNLPFAIGILAVGDEITPGLDNEFQGYLRLRANVYADQTHMIPKEAVRPDGTEMDEDDARSVHFGIFERTEDGARAVGAMRIIKKSEEDSRLLPIEDFFPEAFEAGSAPLTSTEISRYICRHEVAGVQKRLSEPLFSAVVSYIMARNLGPTYAVVEEKVETDLKSKRVPIKRIADPRYVPEYAADNLGTEINIPMMARGMEFQNPGVLDRMRESEGKITHFNLELPVAKGAVA